MINVLICAVLILAAVYCVLSILWHRRQGELCDCPGDCQHCKIQCRSNVQYFGTAGMTMPVMTEQARRRIRLENRFMRVWGKVRQVVDLVCYWIFNLCAIATLIRGLILGIGKLFAR